ncbi:MAG TPA: HAMP domain-containing sensor histidine kinase [Micromonosporaceae bacterium]
MSTAAARVPLRVRFVAVMLGLVFLALVVIGTTSTVKMRSHLFGRVDNQLSQQLTFFASADLTCEDRTIPIPSDYLVAISRPDCDAIGYYRNYYRPSEVPQPPRTAAEAVALDRPYTVSSLDNTRRWRLRTAVLPQGEVLTVGEDLSNVDGAIDQLVWVNLLTGGLVLLALALVGVWLVRMSLRPLVDIEQTAGAIARGDLSRRVPEGEPSTELGRLSRALNAMLSQIETAFRARAESEAQAVRSEQRMRQFVADASHELRTPLTSIRGFAELYRHGAVVDATDVVRRIEDEAARMGLLVEDLLLLARLDQERPLRIEPVHLVELVNDAAAAAHAMAPERPLTVDLGEGAGGLVVAGDQARLRQVVGNLVTNALMHTPSATPVSLRLHGGPPGYAVLEVTDRGPGLAPEQAEQVFERFYRVDKARTRQGVGAPGLPHSGAGLGLAIVAALVAAHHGTVELDTAPGEGANFRVTLPLAPPVLES